jgi:hypothetical protein
VTIDITQQDLDEAVTEGIITFEQREALLRRATGKSKFNVAHLAYYLGAMLVIGAMGWFVTEAWDQLGGAGIAAVGAIYAIVFVLAGKTAWDKYGLRVPGGLLYTMAVWMTPLVAYGVERATGLWPQGDPGSYRDYHIWVRGSWIGIELATIVAGLVALRVRRFPFLTFPIAFALWYMSMDIVPLLLRREEFSWNERNWISVGFGVFMLVVAYLIDLFERGEEDYAFWCYLFGLLAFWGGLSVMQDGSEAGKLVYFLINLALLVKGVFLRRKQFLVFGALGCFGYIGHLAWTVFKDSVLFPFVLTLAGLAVIALGIFLQRRSAAIEAWFQRRIPAVLRRLVPPQRG